MLAGIAGLDDPYGSLPTWDILWFYDAGATAQGLAPQYNHPDGYRQGNAALGHKVPSFPAMKGYIYIYHVTPGQPLSNHSKQCASKYSCCSSQAGHKGKEFLMQTYPFVSSPMKGFFLPQVSRGQENSKITGKTSARLRKLLDTLQKCRYLSLLFWHAPTGLQTGSRVVILYTLFSSLHFGQLAPAPAHLHSAVLEHASKSSS